MIAAADIRDALRTWLETALSITVIYADRASPRPATPYATLKLLSMRNIGFDDHGTLTDPGAPALGTQSYKGDRVLTASINVFGNASNDPWDLIRTAMNALNAETARSQLATAGLFPRRVTALDDLTGLMDTEWEPRAHFDHEFALADEYTDEMGLIEHVEAEGTFESPNMTHAETYTIN